MGKLIVIDPGHGGYDPGAVGLGRKEKDVVLQYGLKLSKELKRRGYRVVMTRTNDSFITLKRRVEIANSRRADLFISLHLNSAGSSSANGFETFYHSSSTNGRRMASIVQNRVAPFYRSNRGIKTNPLYVTRRTAMPAVLLELGFIINRQDLATTINKMDDIVFEIANSVNLYFGRGAQKRPNPASFKTYRVRYSWTNKKGQRGPFRSLGDAKRVADSYMMNVYDEKGKLVYKGNHWAEKHFISLKKKGYIFTDRRFNDKVSRGELFAALDKVLKKKEGKIVSKGKAGKHWAEKHFDSLKKKGYVFTDKRFDDKVSRGELFAALDKVLK